mmetsp:Transcript_34969/g.64285  ORF Transcript_34969/g.64285 Transcript_34969/m.64285 type:complete len:360 (+) Transcript_34969:89-1168(+)
MKCTAAFLWLSSHRAHSLSLVPQRLTPRPTFGSPPSLATSPPRRTRATKLFSANAIAAGGAPNSDNVTVNYGPAITLGKLKINLFGGILGLWEVFWGVVYWYPAMILYSILRTVSSKLPGDFMQKIDPHRRIPNLIGFAWALVSYTPFGMWPVVEGREHLEVLREVRENGKKGKLKPAMYVANHSSWMDIPFFAWLFGLVNYKFIAKAELKKVPILGRSVKIGGHVTLDRTNRRSQMETYKTGVQWLKDGVNLVTFPEGTRTKTGRMGSFKKGAFKMAQAVGTPVVPISIHYADVVHPLDYVFPAKSSWTRPRAVVKIGKPIATEGKLDDELLEEVWQVIADGLPECQKPAKDTPIGVK